MAYKNSSLLLARVLLASILLAIAGQAVATRDMPRNTKKEDQMKQPEWLHGHDRSVLIPGLGRVLLPPVHLKHHHPFTGSTGGHSGPHPPYTGGQSGPHPPYTGGTGGSAGGHSGGATGGAGHIPGGDDTFVPNPGFEVPIPGGQGTGSAGTPPRP